MTYMVGMYYESNGNHFEINFCHHKSDRKNWQQVVLCSLLPGALP